MSTALLAIWAALMSADRIDLAGGTGAFILTPFLAITPLVLLSESLRRFRTGFPVHLNRGTLFYLLTAGAYLVLSVGSVLVAPDVTIGTSRVFLLIVNVLAPLAVAALCFDRTNLERILARGALVWLVLCVAFDVAEVLYWIGRLDESIYLGPVQLRFGDFQTLGPLPRLTGVVGDANHTGFIVLCNMVLIARGEPRAWLRRSGLTLAVLLLLATFSRSAMLGAIAALIVAALDARRASPRLLIIAPLAAGFVAALALASPRTFDTIATAVASPISSRLSASEGSAQAHVELLERGLDEATASPGRVLIGMGYGNSHMALQDFFPGNKYGSFHSMYVATFAESGAFALLLFLIMSGVPIIMSRPWRAVIAGSVAFNIFYQTNTDPMFWFVLALAWMTISWQRYAPRVSVAPALP